MIDEILNGFSFEFLFLVSMLVGLCMIFIMGWCFTVTITAAIAIHQKRSVREAIQPLLDEF